MPHISSAYFKAVSTAVRSLYHPLFPYHSRQHLLYIRLTIVLLEEHMALRKLLFRQVVRPPSHVLKRRVGDEKGM
jgi:hypothetical protein